MSLPTAAAPLSRAARHLILWAAFLGWMFSGVQMSLMNLASRSATEDFIRRGQIPLVADSGVDQDAAVQPQLADESAVKRTLSRESPRWFSYYNSAFLFGAALGGLIFGWLGDRAGRVRAMGLSILWYSVFAGLGYAAASPEQLLVLRFASAMGVGGMWPTGVSLAAEAWDDVSRPMLAGLIGTAANVGIVAMGLVGYAAPITVASWRWIMLVAALPVVLGAVVLALVPESPAWLAARERQQTAGRPRILGDLFRPPLLRLTLLGIALGAIPLLGGWGVTAWLIPWSDQVLGATDPKAKAFTSIMRAGGGSIGSLIGGWVANLCGRRLTYFLISLLTVLTSELIYFTLRPSDAWFSPMVFVVGFISTIFFGWLPLYLPEMFPTHARASGAGISFNFGRILTGLGVLGTGALTAWFGEDYSAAGKVTSLVYALGMIVILFAPDTSKKRLN
ncbi:MAG: MFS transporter [Planctomycetaceae bacterium]|nr:MAG: MFS transporter [Planctomycetaceae bacterium]